MEGTEGVGAGKAERFSGKEENIMNFIKGQTLDGQATHKVWINEDKLRVYLKGSRIQADLMKGRGRDREVMQKKALEFGSENMKRTESHGGETYLQLKPRESCYATERNGTELRLVNNINH